MIINPDKGRPSKDGPSFISELGRKLVAGGIAGIVGTTIIYPIDICKTRIQASHQAGFWSKVEVVKGIGREAGLRGYYRGLSANLIGVTPEKAIKLTVNDLLRKALAKRRGSKNDGELPALDGMLAGGVAGACQSIATNPMEMVKINMQLNRQKSAATGLMDTVRALGLRGMYKGTAATLMRDVPFSMIFFQSFAGLDEALRRRQGTDQLGLPYVLLAGFGAGCIGAVAATPMDLVKTRYQAEWFASKLDGTLTSRSIPKIWQETIKEEGVSALFKGSLQRCFIVGPLFGVSLMIFHLQQRIFH